MKTFEYLLSSLESELVFRSESSPLPLDNIESFDPDKKLSSFTIFADEEFNIGVAWYCTDEKTGSIYRVDPEYGKSEEFVNSSIKTFKESIKAASEWSSIYNSEMIMKDPNLSDLLLNEISSIDPKAFESENSQWPGLIDHIKICASDYDEEQEFWFKLT